MAVSVLRAASIQHSLFLPPLKNKLILSPSISHRFPNLFALLLIPNSSLFSTQLNSFHFNSDFRLSSLAHLIFSLSLSLSLIKWTRTWFGVKSVASDAIKFSRLADLYLSSFAVDWHRRWWTLFLLYSFVYRLDFTVFFSVLGFWYVQIYTYYVCFCQMIRFLQVVMLPSCQIPLLPRKKPMRLFLYLHLYILLGFIVVMVVYCDCACTFIIHTRVSYYFYLCEISCGRYLTVMLIGINSYGNIFFKSWMRHFSVVLLVYDSLYQLYEKTPRVL